MISVGADPGFLVGECGPIFGGHGPLKQAFSMKSCVRMKELGPVGTRTKDPKLLNTTQSTP